MSFALAENERNRGQSVIQRPLEDRESHMNEIFEELKRVEEAPENAGVERYSNEAIPDDTDNIEISTNGFHQKEPDPQVESKSDIEVELDLKIEPEIQIDHIQKPQPENDQDVVANEEHIDCIIENGIVEDIKNHEVSDPQFVEIDKHVDKQAEVMDMTEAVEPTIEPLPLVVQAESEVIQDVIESADTGLDKEVTNNTQNQDILLEDLTKEISQEAKIIVDYIYS